jgi:ABC-2 type transport system ATP-binding protein
MIQAQSLTKFYGEHPAVRDLTFEARKGEILGFLGPNGAGKTTTMRILTGYMPPSRGRAKVAGFDVVEESMEVRRRVGYLPETVPLYPELSVVEYLAFIGALRRVPDLDGRIDAVLEEVHLVERADSYIGNLSKGLRQRVGLAQALLHQPEVLILDEPTIGLDPAQIIEVRKLIQGLGKDRTVLLSTHILSEAQQVCDRVVIINKGAIVAEDTPAHLQSQLAGAERIVVKVADGDGDLRSRLTAIPGVVSVQDGAVRGDIEISSSPGRDVRAQIAKTIVEAGHDLLELRAVGVSLEEIFLQLTADESADKDGG